MQSSSHTHRAKLTAFPLRKWADRSQLGHSLLRTNARTHVGALGEVRKSRKTVESAEELAYCFSFAL